MILDSEITRNLYNPKVRKATLEEALYKVNNPSQVGHIELVQQWAIIGECYKLERKSIASEKAYKKAFALAQEIDDVVMSGSVLKHLGNAMYFCNEYQKAINYYKLALKIFEQRQSFSELMNIYSQISYAYEKLGNRKQERDFLRYAIAISDIEPVIQGNFIERLALSLVDSKRYTEAAENYEKALSLYESENFKKGWQERIRNLAQIYNLIGDKEVEKQTLQRLL